MRIAAALAERATLQRKDTSEVREEGGVDTDDAESQTATKTEPRKDHGTQQCVRSDTNPENETTIEPREAPKHRSGAAMRILAALAEKGEIRSNERPSQDRCEDGALGAEETESLAVTKMARQKDRATQPVRSEQGAANPKNETTIDPRETQKHRSSAAMRILAALERKEAHDEQIQTSRGEDLEMKGEPHSKRQRVEEEKQRATEVELRREQRKRRKLSEDFRHRKEMDENEELRRRKVEWQKEGLRRLQEMEAWQHEKEEELHRKPMDDRIHQKERQEITETQQPTKRKQSEAAPYRETEDHQSASRIVKSPPREVHTDEKPHPKDYATYHDDSTIGSRESTPTSTRHASNVQEILSWLQDPQKFDALMIPRKQCYELVEYFGGFQTLGNSLSARDKTLKELEAQFKGLQEERQTLKNRQANLQHEMGIMKKQHDNALEAYTKAAAHTLYRIGFGVK